MSHCKASWRSVFSPEGQSVLNTSVKGADPTAFFELYLEWLQKISCFVKFGSKVLFCFLMNVLHDFFLNVLIKRIELVHINALFSHFSKNISLNLLSVSQ